VVSATVGRRLGEHAVYPGTFDPLTPGHLDIIDRARHLFTRLTVLVAVNSAKRPAGGSWERAQPLRDLAPQWENVAVAAWSGLTVDFCRQHNATVIIRGVRNPSDLRHEYQLAAMNETLGVTTLLLPAQPALSGVSSTLLRSGRPA
jgi:pantetheine-phosphate adenylyltransferase